jgi:hypothetical protein
MRMISSRRGSYSAEFHHVLGAAVRVPAALALDSNSGGVAAVAPGGGIGADQGSPR